MKKLKAFFLAIARRFGYRQMATVPLAGKETMDYAEARHIGEMGKILWKIKHGGHKKGMAQLQKLAEQGDAVAQINYGSEYPGAKNY